MAFLLQPTGDRLILPAQSAFEVANMQCDKDLLRCPKNTLRDRVPIELSQTRENWRYLQRRKPFGVLAEGLISENSRDDEI
jgi:hypothetical protein